MILDDAVRGAESETGAFADGLGGVEGVEDAFGIAQAGAGIGELNDYFVDFAPERNLQTAAADFLERVDGVFHDLKKCLQELIGIAENARQRCLVIALHGQADAFVFEFESLHLNGALEKRFEVERTFFSGRLLRKAEQIVDEFASAAGLLPDFLGGGELLTSEVAAGRHVLGAAEDGGQWELEFAGGEGDEFSERSEFSLLNHAALQALKKIG